MLIYNLQNTLDINTQSIQCKYAKYENKIKSKRNWVIAMNGKENIYKKYGKIGNEFSRKQNSLVFLLLLIEKKTIQCAPNEYFFSFLRLIISVYLLYSELKQDRMYIYS